jgi:flagellar protein FliS
VPIANNANAYKQQEILTAPPERLTLMLYNGCLRFMNEAAQAIADKKIQKAHNACMKSENILQELMDSLNMEYPISTELRSLYEFCQHQMIMANLRKDASFIDGARTVIINIRDGWVEAMKTARREERRSAPREVSGGSIVI